MRLLLLLCCLCALACTRGQLVGIQSSAPDTVRALAWGPIGKLKARTVIVQVGTGNVASPADNTKAGQRQGSAATAPGAVATTTTRPGGLSWWFLLLAALVGAAGWACLGPKLPAKRLPWRARPP